MAGKEIEKQLVLEYGAPEYVNHQEEFVTKEEYQEAYEVFQNELELGLISLIFLGEKRLFKKNRLGQKSSEEELQQLVSSRKPLEDEIRTLNEVLKENTRSWIKSS